MATNQGQKFGDLVSDLQGHKSWLGVMPICWYTDTAIGMFTVYCLVLETCTPSPQMLSSLHLHTSDGVGAGERITNLAH